MFGCLLTAVTFDSPQMSAEVTVDMIANHHPVGTAGGSLAVGPLSDEFEAEMIFEGPATMTFRYEIGIEIGRVQRLFMVFALLPVIASVSLLV